MHKLHFVGLNCKQKRPKEHAVFLEVETDLFCLFDVETLTLKFDTVYLIVKEKVVRSGFLFLLSLWRVKHPLIKFFQGETAAHFSFVTLVKFSDRLSR